jgi:acyl carrier protein
MVLRLTKVANGNFRIVQFDVLKIYLPFPLGNLGDVIAPFFHMEVSKKISPTPTELIDWLNDEGVLELDWDFPEDGILAEAGLDSMAVMQLVVAVEDRYGIELGPEDLTKANLATPITLAALIVARTS